MGPANRWTYYNNHIDKLNSKAILSLKMLLLKNTTNYFFLPFFFCDFFFTLWRIVNFQNTQSPNLESIDILYETFGAVLLP